MPSWPSSDAAGRCRRGDRFSNEDYVDAGAVIVDRAKQIFDESELIVKVKEPQPEECKMLRQGQLLFTYLHLAPDLVIGAVLVPGATAPKVLTRDSIRHMQGGSVVVDVAIDQGGSFETSKPTTHKDPVYVVDEVAHYCVTNMPGAVARTATQALNNAVLPFALALAEKGAGALLEDRNLRNGLNVHRGQVTYRAVSAALGLDYVDAATALAGPG